MYAPSTIAAASVCAAFNGLTANEQNQTWTRTELVSFLQGLTKVEPVRSGNDWVICKNAPRSFETVLMENTFAIIVVGITSAMEKHALVVKHGVKRLDLGQKNVFLYPVNLNYFCRLLSFSPLFPILFKFFKHLAKHLVQVLFCIRSSVCHLLRLLCFT